jgi:hypothetical protein
VGVVGLALVDGTLAGVADVAGSGEVRLPDVEPDRTGREKSLVGDLANPRMSNFRGPVGKRR